MKILFIGGTGLISSACSELVVARGYELFVLNRSASTKYSAPNHSTILQKENAKWDGIIEAYERAFPASRGL